MRRFIPCLAVVVSSCSLFSSLAGAQPGGIIDPETNVRAIEPGQDVLTFSGTSVTIANLRFVAKGYRTIAKLRTGADAAKLVDAGWTNVESKPLKLTSKASGPSSLKCAIPEDARGLVLEYTTQRGVFEQPTVSLNGSQVSLWTIQDRPYECLLKLRREGGRAQFDGEPIMNLWELHGIAPGAVFDETHCEIETTPGSDPLSAGEYRIHVSYVADERRVRSPAVPCKARVSGIDLTQYDGYVIKFKSPDARRFSASMIDSTNFFWSGSGGKLDPDEWASLAIPFDVHANHTTAGDGVLKLSELALVYCGIGSRPDGVSPTGEYWVGTPQFYKGDPPENVPVAESRPRMLCAVTSLAPERRKPHFFEGVSIQSIHQQGEVVWLGTDRGIIKNSRSQPGLKMAQYSLPEGLVDDDVQCVHADGDTLWVGTTCGMSRFDGERFQSFTSADGLLPGPVMGINHDDKYVWLAMARGIARFDKSSGEITARKGRGGWSPESTGGQGVPVQEGRGVYADSIAVDPEDGSVWHAAAGLTHSRPDGGEIRHFLGTTKRVLAVHPDEAGVWIVSAHGIELINREDGEYLQNYGIGSRKGLGLGRHSAFITCAYPQKEGIWLGYSDGIGWFDPQEKSCHWSPYYSVAMGSLVPQCIFADGRNVWVGTDNGLMVFPMSKARASWDVLEYSAPTDLWAAGVNMTFEDVCDDGCDMEALQSVSLDDEGGSPGSPGALLLTYDFSKDADDCAKLCQRFDVSLPNCNGVAFRAKTDAAYKGKEREFFVDVSMTAKMGRQTRRIVLRDAIKVDTKWRAFKIPFAKMKLVSGSGRVDTIDHRTIHLTGVDLSRSVADHHCPDDAGKLWFDRLEWVSLRGNTA